MTSHRRRERRKLGRPGACGFEVAVTVQNNSPEKVNGWATDWRGLKSANGGVTRATAFSGAGYGITGMAKAGSYV
jgi:hypothetical protein